jgi:hypothetical protein
MILSILSYISYINLSLEHDLLLAYTNKGFNRIGDTVFWMANGQEGFGVLNRQPEEPVDVGDVSGLVKDLMRRVRVLEERYASIRKNIQVNEQNMLAINKSLTTEMRALSMELGDVKQSVHSVKEEMRLIVNELRETVKKDEIKVLEKYIQLWEPLNFVSHEEMQRFVAQELQNKSFIKKRDKG